MMMCMMPVVGFLEQGRSAQAYRLWLRHAHGVARHHTPWTSASVTDAWFLRCFQASGLAFLFIPINTIAYIGVKQSENNDVSGLTNLARNIGGSCGTAFMATMLTRRTAAHENNMVRNLTTGNPGFMNQVAQLKGMFGGHTSGNPMVGSGSHSAQAYIYNQLHRQAAMLGYRRHPVHEHFRRA
jgi:DHA2 family multidrug resistance protein